MKYDDTELSKEEEESDNEGEKKPKKPSVPTKTGDIKVTGNIQEVMQESTDIAYTYAFAWLQKHRPTNYFLRTSKLHMHFPEVRNVI